MKTAPAPSRDAPHAPPLEAGDRLDRVDFERRYEATPWVKRAELIDGVVYLPNPRVSFLGHGAPHAAIVGWLAMYAASTRNIQVGDNSSIRLGPFDMPQPDAAAIIQFYCGGQTRLASDGFLEGAPEIIAEVCGSGASIELHAKFDMYQRHGVCEYIVWRVHDSELDWFSLARGCYQKLSTVDGIIRSEIFPGLWLDVRAMMDDNPAKALAVLRDGLSTLEHSEFATLLKARNDQLRQG